MSGAQRCYLGLDSSTQSLSAILIGVTGGRAEVLWQDVMPFDQAFPEFGTVHGVLPVSYTHLTLPTSDLV